MIQVTNTTTVEMIEASDLFYKYEGSGLSFYRGVWIEWSYRGPDYRVIEVIDNMIVSRKELFSVHYHEGCVDLKWKTHVPQGYETGEFINLDDDCWSITSSSVVKKGSLGSFN